MPAAPGGVRLFLGGAEEEEGSADSGAVAEDSERASAGVCAAPPADAGPFLAPFFFFFLGALDASPAASAVCSGAKPPGMTGGKGTTTGSGSGVCCELAVAVDCDCAGLGVVRFFLLAFLEDDAGADDDADVSAALEAEEGGGGCWSWWAGAGEVEWR